MNTTKYIAIDFGSSRISAMAGEVLEDGAIRILSEESKHSDDVKWGIIEKPTGASYKVSELLKLLKNSSKLPEDISRVSVSIGAKSMKQQSASISRFVGKPNEVTENLLTEMLAECQKKSEHEEIHIYDVIPISYILDGTRMDDPVGHKANQITANYNVIYGQKIIKSELDRCFDRTGILLDFNPLSIEALSTVLTEEQEREVGCALINFGATTTTLGVYHDGALQQLMVVPLGAYNITKDIQEMGISEENAERFKRLQGYALERMVESPMYVQIPSAQEDGSQVRISTKFLATIIEARLDEILQPIFETISRLTFKLDAGIVITGGGSKLKSIIEFISEKTGIYTRLGDHSGWLSDDTNERFLDPVYAQLIGTILLTDEYRKENPLEISVVESEKKPKLPKRGFGEKITERIFDFFNDDNKLN